MNTTTINNNIKIDRSANHCHLTEETAHHIFGGEIDEHILKCKPLDIEGEYATDLVVCDFSGNKYRVLYPWREYNQIEVAQSDYYKMFKQYAHRRSSGDINRALTIRVLDLHIPVIVPKPHIHLAYEINEIIKFPFELEKKVSPTTDGYHHIHLDTDQYAAIQGMYLE